MLIELKIEVAFERADGTLVKKPAGTRVNYSALKIEPDEFQHLITTNDPKTGGRLCHTVRMPSCRRPAYL